MSNNPQTAPAAEPPAILAPSDTFVHRHIGPRDAAINAMLETIGVASLDALIDQTVPADIRLRTPLKLGEPRGEHELLNELRECAEQNQMHRALIGMGYYDCITPPVILRNILENPGWYTQYTPYQAEIAQGRLEALLNFQTMVADLTALPVANASLLDEATAAAEAMTMAFRAAREKRRGFFVAEDCHPQTIAVLETRAEPLGISLFVGTPDEIDFEKQDLFGVLVQYPATDGRIADFAELATRTHKHDALFVVATDLLALTLLTPPGEFGADVAVGSAQRFGVPLGFGGPHAAFISCTENLKRMIPGRLVGVSKDARGRHAYRLSIQTREQHIRREKATSNICTAQVLLAILAGMYAVYHGPDGLRRIAQRVHAFTRILAAGIRELGHEVADGPYFDTLRITPHGVSADELVRFARSRQVNLRRIDRNTIGVSLDEKTDADEIDGLWSIFADGEPAPFTFEQMLESTSTFDIDARFARQSDFLTHEVFHAYHAEHEMLRYLHRLQSRDLSLCQSMIPLGSCTMKLNGTSELLPITWPEFANVHPFAPADQARGYQSLFNDLERWLVEITGFAAVSLQPNAGAQGEYAGLLTIRAYHAARGDRQRDICLIPTSAHGTNPASAIMAGMTVVPVACDDLGNIDIADLRTKAEKHADRLAAIMITYPSTHGVFEPSIREFCDIVHQHGGQVYLDGANLNAQVGIARPGDYGADVCHLNLHKTFCIPHGGGGPGMGPICVAEHLAPFLPGHPLAASEDTDAIGPVAAAPFGSPSILPISWMYIALMGASGLTKASQVAVLNANYMMTRLRDHYPVLYTGPNGRVAHEFIIDLRGFKKSADIDPDDVAKRLMDFGFHAPTMSWPVAGTLMIEPTESESKAELDRFCDALIAIRAEIREIEDGRADRANNVLKHAPHTAADLADETWGHPYTREQAAFPAAWMRAHKFWPPVNRIDNVYGDRHLFCTCPPMQDSADACDAGSMESGAASNVTKPESEPVAH